MDYLYFSSIRNGSPADLVVSYDIACQWSRNINSRSASYPPELVEEYPKALTVTYLVPKFHLYAHRTSCQINYSFNLTRGVGRTDGESPERGWAAMNPVASSTKEMGPGSRRDTLDDHFGDYNWRKVASLRAKPTCSKDGQYIDVDGGMYRYRNTHEGTRSRGNAGRARSQFPRSQRLPAISKCYIILKAYSPVGSIKV